jgi:hypothetical protein
MHQNPRHATGALVRRPLMNDRKPNRNTTAIKSGIYNPVEFLMAKAYRGVSYVDAHYSAPAQSSEDKRLSYRGVPHVHIHNLDLSHGSEVRQFVYRGQRYRR